ncbi:hypothetical protein MAHJHV63_49290 [Mycobacterium avium subsp. hominissuis]
MMEAGLQDVPTKPTNCGKVIREKRSYGARVGHVPWSGVRAVACPRVALW